MKENINLVKSRIRLAKASQVKDFMKRKELRRLEITRLKYLMLKNNRIVGMKMRIFANRELDSLSGEKTKVRNRCILTGRGNSVIKEYGFSRIVFRNLADQGYIQGVKRSSW